MLALSGDGGYPYAVPLSYAYGRARQSIIFHCAKEGHKIDAIRSGPNASFCVIDRDVAAQEQFTAPYRSVIAFGRARILVGEAERRSAIEFLPRRLAPEAAPEAEREEIERFWNAFVFCQHMI